MPPPPPPDCCRLLRRRSRCRRHRPPRLSGCRRRRAAGAFLSRRSRAVAIAVGAGGVVCARRDRAALDEDRAVEILQRLVEFTVAAAFAFATGARCIGGLSATGTVFACLTSLAARSVGTIGTRISAGTCFARIIGCRRVGAAVTRGNVSISARLSSGPVLAGLAVGALVTLAAGVRIVAPPGLPASCLSLGAGAADRLRIKRGLPGRTRLTAGR